MFSISFKSQIKEKDIVGRMSVAFFFFIFVKREQTEDSEPSLVHKRQIEFNNTWLILFILYFIFSINIFNLLKSNNHFLRYYGLISGLHAC
jgi:hypothetical protein